MLKKRSSVGYVDSNEGVQSTIQLNQSRKKRRSKVGIFLVAKKGGYVTVLKEGRKHDLTSSLHFFGKASLPFSLNPTRTDRFLGENYDNEICVANALLDLACYQITDGYLVFVKPYFMSEFNQTLTKPFCFISIGL